MAKKTEGLNARLQLWAAVTSLPKYLSETANVSAPVTPGIAIQR